MSNSEKQVALILAEPGKLNIKPFSSLNLRVLLTHVTLDLYYLGQPTT